MARSVNMASISDQRGDDVHKNTQRTKKKREKPKPPVVSADALASTQHALHIEVHTQSFPHPKNNKKVKKKIKREKFVVFRVD